ncbi:PASTA domain-containing protein, partial [Curtobacterium sp. B8]|uniref:PASTA domain-containing protein n=1 Tax=Curtobacterium sp. B8 TaxID=95611 RepID=UPI0011D1CDC7
PDARARTRRVSSDYSATVPEGTVLSSDPAGGATATKGTVVNLTVSNGKVQLPDVTNQQFTQANQTLTNLGLTVGQNPSYSCTGGLVTQQDQPAGDIAQGSTVTLTYCAGSTQTDNPTPSGDSNHRDRKRNNG